MRMIKLRVIVAAIAVALTATACSGDEAIAAGSSVPKEVSTSTEPILQASQPCIDDIRSAATAFADFAAVSASNVSTAGVRLDPAQLGNVRAKVDDARKSCRTALVGCPEAADEILEWHDDHLDQIALMAADPVNNHLNLEAVPAMVCSGATLIPPGTVPATTTTSTIALSTCEKAFAIWQSDRQDSSKMATLQACTSEPEWQQAAAAAVANETIDQICARRMNAPTTACAPADARRTPATDPPPTTRPPARTPATSPSPASSGTGSVSQQNARRKAESYLSYSAFSRSGLIDQLEYEGFSTAESTIAVDTVDVDWNEQAAMKAASYLSYSSFSRSGLFDQLLYEGFTSAQAEYGVGTTGL